jgi:hypothetical protein
MGNLIFPPQVIEHAFSKFQATLSPELREKFNGHLEWGLAIALSGGVATHTEPGMQTNGNLYKVVSSDPDNPPYLVDLHARSCTCPDHWKGHFCKHRIAANIISITLQLSKAEVEQPKAVEKPPAKATPPTPTQAPAEQAKKEAVIWGVIRLDGKFLGVEVLSIEDQSATVRALPTIIEGKKLQPQFPFECHRNATTIPRKELFHVKVFQHT